MENTIRFRGSLREPQRTLNRVNIAPRVSEAKRRAKKRFRAISLALGVVALSTFTFKRTYEWQVEKIEQEQSQLLDMAMAEFVAYNPAMLKIEAIEVGQSEPTSGDSIIVDWLGVALGYDKEGKVEYSNPHVNYLIFNRADYKLTP